MIEMVEHEEEAAELEAANSDSDPAINSSEEDAPAIYDIMYGDSGSPSMGTDESDQDQSFEPDSEAEEAERQKEAAEAEAMMAVDPQYHHLKEEGYSVSDMVKLQQEVERLQDMASLMGSMVYWANYVFFKYIFYVISRFFYV